MCFSVISDSIYQRQIPKTTKYRMAALRGEKKKRKAPTVEIQYHYDMKY